MAESVSDVLATARSTIAAGWTQRTPADGYGGFCIEGAVYHALGTTDGDPASLDDAQYAAAQAAFDRLARELPTDWCPSMPSGTRLSEWNDSRERTKAEVAALFEATLEHGCVA